jgi:hypothetical protein
LEIEDIVGKELFEKHIEFRLNVDISLDSKRVWCPKPDCNTVVKTTGLKTNFLCGKCKFEFCSLCLDAWHSTLSCEDYGKCSRIQIPYVAGIFFFFFFEMIAVISCLLLITVYKNLTRLYLSIILTRSQSSRFVIGMAIAIPPFLGGGRRGRGLREVKG